MAVPARKTSKSRKNKRRAQHKIKGPAVYWNPELGEYVVGHRVSAKGFYKGKKIN